jgi:hypothetical protein
MDATLKEMLAKTDANQEKMDSRNWAWRRESTSCQEATEACLESYE